MTLACLTVMNHRDNQEVGVAHEAISFRNQPQFSQTISPTSGRSEILSKVAMEYIYNGIL